MTDARRIPIDGGPTIVVTDLGRLDYDTALEVQRARQRSVIEARGEDGGADLGHVLLLEHDPPVITVSRRRDAAAHLLATPAQLEAAGVQVRPTDRGGDVTYHGPGQLVVYPILDLNHFGLRLHGYMRLLEDAVIATLDRFGVRGMRDPGATGVWVPRRGDDPGTGAKICAMGVRVSRWVTMHGLALNVTTNLDHFRLINPCGLDRPVTSLAAEHAAPGMDQVKQCLVSALLERLSERSRETTSPERG